MAFGVGGVEGEGGAGLAAGVVGAAEEFGADVVGVDGVQIGDASRRVRRSRRAASPSSSRRRGLAGVGRTVGQERAGVADQICRAGLASGLARREDRQTGPATPGSMRRPSLISGRSAKRRSAPSSRAPLRSAPSSRAPQRSAPSSRAPPRSAPSSRAPPRFAPSSRASLRSAPSSRASPRSAPSSRARRGSPPPAAPAEVRPLQPRPPRSAPSSRASRGPPPPAAPARGPPPPAAPR